ncbi:ribonuclease H-like domain-containing protein [Podospora didyma]|uniref:Ribonuclease H-like domain-containing protein n=1 Tax=Podospora didyma TaxID=330526 RepID=A0AAE0K0Q7_9PEZI|nr:ribonuclease H-like domain-containing protein [Podospora didyma]
MYTKTIIIYRDGVSEGQYQHVINDEYAHFKNVCESVYTKVKKSPPKIAIIVTTTPAPAGTVVHRGVTNQFMWDFYLQARKAIKGTARPAHYAFVMDDF